LILRNTQDMKLSLLHICFIWQFLDYAACQQANGMLLQEQPLTQRNGVENVPLKIPGPSIMNDKPFALQQPDTQSSLNPVIISPAQNIPNVNPIASLAPGAQVDSFEMQSGDQKALFANPHPALQIESSPMKREEERYEATILGNPKPKVETDELLTNFKGEQSSKMKAEEEKLEAFVKQNAHEIVKDLTPSERRIESEENEKDTSSDDLKEVLKNANLKMNKKFATEDGSIKSQNEETSKIFKNEITAPNKENNNNSKNNNNHENLTNLKSEEQILREYSNLIGNNVLGSQHHHIEPDTTDDQLALTEEEHLTKKLDFLKDKLKQRQKLFQQKEDEKIHDENKQFVSTSSKNNENENEHEEENVSSKPYNKLFLNDIGSDKNMSSNVLDISKDIADKVVDPTPKLTLRNITDVGRTRGPISVGNKAFFAFSYDESSPFGPPSWQILNPEWTCTARKQSPINIETQYLMDNDMVKNIMVKVEPPNSPVFGILRNNGHAPTLSLSSDVTVKLFGGTLKNDYYLKQLHFHFGCDNTEGSEHHINGIIYPLELHLVFWDNSTFATFPEAAKADRGIAVVAVLYQLENIPYPENKNTPLSQVIQILRHIEEEGDNVTVNEEFNFRLEKLIPNIMSPDSVDRFYTYEGSLTTPGCYESVTWVVMATHPSVTENQLRIFRTLKSSKVNYRDKMCNNFRPVQKKNGRRIYSNII